VILEVVDRDGDPDPAMAGGRLTRAPTEEERSFLITQRKERGNSSSYPLHH
jgi:hypothetical protein